MSLEIRQFGGCCSTGLSGEEVEPGSRFGLLDGGCTGTGGVRTATVQLTLQQHLLEFLCGTRLKQLLYTLLGLLERGTGCSDCITEILYSL